MFKKYLVAALAVAAVTFGAAHAQSADSHDRHVVIHNETSDVLYEFHASRIGLSSWQEDMLHSSIVSPGDSVRANIDDGTGYCRYDFLAIFMDSNGAKHNVERRNVNVCVIEDFYYRD